MAETPLTCPPGKHVIGWEKTCRFNETKSYIFFCLFIIHINLFVNFYFHQSLSIAFVFFLPCLLLLLLLILQFYLRIMRQIPILHTYWILLKVKTIKHSLWNMCSFIFSLKQSYDQRVFLYFHLWYIEFHVTFHYTHLIVNI